jgi:uncharacterized protein DUF4058
MPSPFPGMDPYVEPPALWPSVHYRMPGLIADHLQPQIAPRYVAVAEERVYLEEPAQEIVPDVSVRRYPQPPGGGERIAGAASSEREALDMPLWIEAPELVEAREYFVEIRALPGQELVTVLEVLSPANKRRTGPGRARYLRKQRRLLGSEVNMVEIDLLRRGAWTVAVPQSSLSSLEPHDYQVCVRRATRPGGFEFYPFRVTQPLPEIRVPLRPGDEDPHLDLTAVFQEAYDRSMVATRIDYAARPDPPLNPQDSAWADDLLRSAGLR